MDRIRPTDITEERIENLIDPEASAIFREAFYAEAKALEKEALAHPVEVDEEQMEALRRRILQSVGAEVDDIEALEKETEDVPERTEAAETPMPKDASLVEPKQIQRRFSPLVRWAAVLVLACMGVLGVSMSSQAKGSGLWSSIQRLIGVETRWEQENNGEDRTYTNPEEYKAIGEIEDTLGIVVPEFFYLPEGVEFSDYEIISDPSRFLMVYEYQDIALYYEGWWGENDASENIGWEGEGKTVHEKYGMTTYTITEVDEGIKGIHYYVTWTEGECKFLLSGLTDLEETRKILKNIKN